MCSMMLVSCVCLRVSCLHTTFQQSYHLFLTHLLTALFELRSFINLDTMMNKWKFYETVAVNRGLNIKIFTVKEEALKWLSD